MEDACWDLEARAPDLAQDMRLPADFVCQILEVKLECPERANSVWRAKPDTKIGNFVLSGDWFTKESGEWFCPKLVRE